MKKNTLFALCLLLLSGCATLEEPGERAPTPEEPPAPTEPLPTVPAGELPPAPWSAPPLDAARVPAHLLAAWRGAENRESCALLLPLSLGTGEDVTARPASFAGGWGVAFDRPDLRSAFGVAGTGVGAADEGTYDEWPYRRAWQDGSRAGYGPEGGSGPNQLAYLRVEGQECLYNVWSRLGRQHLEELLESLRFVAVEP